MYVIIKFVTIYAHIVCEAKKFSTTPGTSNINTTEKKKLTNKSIPK